MRRPSATRRPELAVSSAVRHVYPRCGPEDVGSLTAGKRAVDYREVDVARRRVGRSETVPPRPIAIPPIPPSPERRPRASKLPSAPRPFARPTVGCPCGRALSSWMTPRRLERLSLAVLAHVGQRPREGDLVARGTRRAEPAPGASLRHRPSRGPRRRPTAVAARTSARSRVSSRRTSVRSSGRSATRPARHSCRRGRACAPRRPTSQACPKRRISSMMGRSAVPFSVSSYSARRAAACFSMISSCSRTRRRSESVRGLMPGQERSSSEKRRGPSERSWTMIAVHFEPMMSAVQATAHSSS